jgi:transposase
MLFVGIDWAETRHRVVIVAEDGNVLYRGWIGHDSCGLKAFEELITHWVKPRSDVQVAIELHDSVLLDRLLHCGVTVYGLNPKSAERARDRFTATGVKDDERDAWSLAEFLRTSHVHLRPLRPDSEITLALREWTCLREDLIQERTTQLQRLRNHLVRWHPQMLHAIGDANRDWSLDLLEKYPTADSFARVPRAQIDAWSQGRRLRSATRQRIADAALFSSPTCVASRNAAHAAEVKHRISLIREINRRLAEVEKSQAELVSKHPDAFIFQSLPRCGANTVAAMLGGFGDDRQRWSGHEEVAARWGAAPITIQSGKHRNVQRRLACDRTMHQVWIWYAFNTIQKEGCWAREDYQAKRKAGAEHYTVLRGLADHWIKIAHRCWLDRVKYAETTHQRNRALRAKPKVQP